MANFGTAYIDVAGNFAPLEAEINGLASGPIGKKMTTLGKSLTKNLTLPIVGVGAAAAKLSMDFQRSMTLVSTQAGGSEKEVKKLGDQILKFASKGRFAQGPNELAKGLFDIESAGYRSSKAMKVLKSASDLATVGNADLESTTSALVGAMKTGIEGTGNMKEAIGLLNATIGAGKMHMEDLNAAIGTGFLGSAKGLGVSLQSVGAALAELTAQGVPANSAATRLRMTMSLLANPTSKAKDVLKEIGIGSETLATQMRQPNGLNKALETLQEHMKGLSEVQQSQLLAAAFGGAKSGGTIVQLLGQLGDLNQKYEEIGKNAGDFNKAVRETNADPEVKLQKAWSGIQASLIKLGSAILPEVVPIFSKLADTVSSIGDDFGALSPSSKKLVVEIGFFVAALGPGLTIAGKLVGTFTTLVGVIRKAAAAMGLLDAASAGSGVAGAKSGIIGSVAGGTGAGGAARWLGTEGSQAAFMAAEAKAAGQMTERQALAAQGGIFSGLEGGVAGGAGVGAFGGLFKSSGGIKGAGQVLGRTILGVAGGYITAEIGVHGLKALGVGDPTEGQGIAKGLFHGFNTGKMGNARTEAEGGELVKSRLYEVKPKLSVEAAKKLATQYRGLMHSLQTDSILGIRNIDHDLAQGLRTATTIWGRNTPQWHQHTAQAMQAAVKSIREGMKSGTVDAKQGQKEINNLLAKIHLVKGNDPFGLAEATSKSFKETGAITAKGVKEWEQKLTLMPKGARESSQQSTLQMLRAWSQGHPKIEAQVNQLTRNLITKFGATNKQLREGVKTGATGPVAEAFHGLASGVDGSLQNIGVNVQQVLKALGVKNIPQFQIALATGGGSKFSTRSETEAGLHRQHRETGGFIVPGSGDGDRFRTALPPGSFIENREAAEALPFATGGLMPVALEPGERVYLPQAVMAIGQQTLEARNRAIPRFQKGGSLGPEPQLVGSSGALRSLGQAAIQRVYEGAKAYLAKHKPKGGLFAGPTPAGVGIFQGLPVDKWIIPELLYAVAHGWKGHITSGFRTDAHSAALGFPGDEHTKTSYPGGAVDFGGMNDPTGAANRAAFIAATKGYRGPKLRLPIGFHDDGHMSGTGHQLGGLVQALLSGGKVHGPPLFQGEGPAWYDKAFAHNLPWAKGSAPWETILGGAAEGRFEEWLRRNHVDWSLSAPRHDYDMRGYWKGEHGKAPVGHFPDAWKTPFDTSFSKWSKYAKAGTPFDWVGNWLVDLRSGREIVSGKYAEGGSVTAELLKKAQRVWAAAAPFYGQPPTSTAPPLVSGNFRHGQEAETVHAGFDGAKRSEVKFGGGLVKALLSGKGNLRNWAEESLLHEWAHYFQPALGQKEWEYEGGAEAFARRFAPGIYSQLNIPYANPQFNGYPEFTKRVIKDKGWNWIEKGQFAGHQKGGLVQKLLKGGGVLSPEEWGGAMLQGGFPKIQKVIAEGLGTIKSESSFNASEQSQGPGGHIGGWAESETFGSVAERLNPVKSSAAAFKEWRKDGHSFWQAWGQWEAEQSGLSGGGAGAYGPEYMGVAKQVIDHGVTGTEHSFKEDVPAVYGPCRTDSINFPSMPKSLHGVERELKRWEGEIGKYRRTVKHAQKANKPGIAQALEHNVTAISTQLNKLRAARRKLRFDKAKKALAKRLNKKLGIFARYETGIEGLQRDFNISSQFAEQVVGLEPTQPELPASATDAQREASEKDYVARFTDYVNGRERPAYEDVLGKAGSWRNAILQVEDVVREQEWTWEGGIRRTDDEIDHINDFTRKVAERLAGFRKDHPSSALPSWLSAQLKQRDALRGKLPWLRVEDGELRKSLGEARSEFFAGGKNLIKPPALPLAGSGALEEHLTEVQGIHWPDQHNVLSSLPAGRVAGMFGGAIWDTQTTIEELGLKISQAASGIGGGSGSEDQGKTEREERLEELLFQSMQRNIARSIEERVIGSMPDIGVMPPYAGKAHTGAIVPGPRTQERTMIVRGQEGIFTEEQMAAMGGDGGSIGDIRVQVHGDIVSSHPDPVEVLIGDKRFPAAVERVTSRKERRSVRGASRRLAGNAGVFGG